MHTFSDAKNRQWEIAGNFATYSRVKSRCAVDLTDIVTEERKSLTQLADPFTLGDVIWCLVEVQAERRGISRDDFGEGLDGDAWEAAARALMDEMVFFCRPSARPMLTMTMKKIDEARASLDKRMPEMLVEAERKIDEMFAGLIHGSSETSSPESSASTPANGASAGSVSPRAGGSASSGTTRRRKSPSMRS